MSSNKPKNEAERRADELVTVAQHNGLFRLMIGNTPLSGWEDKDIWRVGPNTPGSIFHIRQAIANAIREAIEARDRIMTDLLSESEAFHEGWRAMSEELVRQCRLSNVPNVADFIEEMTAKAQPPSKTATGEILSPSPVHLRAQQMEGALRAIAKIQADPVIDFTPLLTQIAREALEATNG